MNQVWHIFRKDTRHFWREIVVLFALLIVYAWHEVRSWAHPGSDVYGFGFSTGILRNLPELLGALIAIAWVLVLIRSVQDESLVGDRQFWISRPYDWRELLAAKALFALAYINFPLLMLQVSLLNAARFSAENHVPGLLAMQAGSLLFIFVPVLALACITRTIAQFALGVLGVAAYVAGTAYLDSIVPNSSLPDPFGAIYPFLLIFTLLGIVFLQYSRRATAKSRTLVAVLGVLIIAMNALAPYRWFLRREYPVTADGRTRPFILTVAQQEPQRGNWVSEYRDDKNVQIVIPLNISGLPADSIVHIRNRSVSLEFASGARWESGWGSQRGFVYPDQKEIRVNFEMKRQMFEKEKDSPAKLTLSLAYDAYHDEDRRDFITPPGEFPLSGMGRCISSVGYSRNIECRVPLPRAINVLITTDMSASTCPIEGDAVQAAPGTLARDWKTIEADGPDLGLSPIQTMSINPSPSNTTDIRLNRGICAGTPLVFSHPRLEYKAQEHMSLGDILLSQYRDGSLVFGHLTVRRK